MFINGTFIMKACANSTILTLMALVFTLSGCANTDSTGNSPMQPVANGLTKTEIFDKNKSRYTGTFPDKSTYRIKKFRSGLIRAYIEEEDNSSRMLSIVPEQIWSIHCYVNDMTDILKCRSVPSLISPNGDWRTVSELELTSRGFAFPHLLCIASHDYPGENAFIRFDKDKQISLGTDGCTSSPSTIQKVFTAKTIAIKYSEWPYTGSTEKMLVSDTEDHYRGLLKRMEEIYKSNLLGAF